MSVENLLQMGSNGFVNSRRMEAPVWKVKWASSVDGIVHENG